MRFLELIETINVFEAARDRYMQMFANLPEIALPNYPKAIENNVDWAVKTLKKSDRVVWFLRLYRLYLLQFTLKSLQSALSKNAAPAQKELLLTVENTYKRELAKHVKSSEVPADRIEAMIDRVASTNSFATSAEHFFSLNIPAINGYVFGWKTWAEIMRDLERIEDSWKKKQERIIPIAREGIETLIRFPDKSEWINLNKGSCDIEAKAMGHCGNTAGYTANDTILTYRTIEKDPKTKRAAWIPHLTFILDTSNGMLGEMKGFNNQHPDKKYHSVIIELLKLPLIKGIVGGGYKPENNFGLKDLPEETVKKMMEFKPGLGTLTDHYAIIGSVDHELFNKIKRVLDDAGLPIGDFEHNSEEKVFYINSNIGDIGDVYDAYGQGRIDDDPWVDEENIKGFFENMGDKVKSSLYFYVQKNYGVVPKSGEELYQFLKDEDDDLINKVENIFKEIFKDGIRLEAETWIDNMYDMETPAYLNKEGDKYQLLVNEDEFMNNVLPKAQGSGSTTWTHVLGGPLLPDPTESFLASMYDEDDWIYEHAENMFITGEETREYVKPTPEEMGQFRLFKDEEEQRLAAST